MPAEKILLDFASWANELGAIQGLLVKNDLHRRKQISYIQHCFILRIYSFQENDVFWT